MARQKYSLQGDAAQEWLVERHFLGDVGPGFRLVSDEIEFPEYRATRVWHTEGRYLIERSSPSALILLQIEGRSTLASPQWEETKQLGPGDVAVLPAASASYSFSAQGPVARYQIECSLAGLPLVARSDIMSGRIYSGLSKEYRDAVVAAANIALNSTMSRGEAGFADFGMGLRHLTAALLQHAFDTSAPVGPNAVSPLHHAALRVIATRATDADFDVTMLADAVGTSPRNLRHVFAQAGSWAKVELTAERVRRARAYLAQSVGNPQFTPAEIARLSGFRDVRALTRALAKHDGEAPPPRGGRQRRDDTTRT